MITVFERFLYWSIFLIVSCFELEEFNIFSSKSKTSNQRKWGTKKHRCSELSSFNIQTISRQFKTLVFSSENSKVQFKMCLRFKEGGYY